MLSFLNISGQLARYLNRNFWEKKQEEVRKSPTPSAPLSMGEPATQATEVPPAPLSVVEVGTKPFCVSVKCHSLSITQTQPHHCRVWGIFIYELGVAALKESLRVSARLSFWEL